MNDELRDTFGNVQKALISALTNDSIGKSAENWEMVRDGQKTMIDQECRI